jgi:hypothetical protein
MDAYLVKLGKGLDMDGQKWVLGLAGKLKEADLLEPKHLVTLVEDGGAALLESAFPDATVAFKEDVVKVVDEFLNAMKGKAAWKARLESRGCDPRLEDVLDVVERDRKKMKMMEDIVRPGTEISSTGSSGVRVRATWGTASGTRCRDLKDLDEKEMKKWSERAVKILADAQVPSWVQAMKMDNPEAVMRGILGRSRASTIRLRVRTWEAYARWLSWRRGRMWPSEVGDILDYVVEQMDDQPAASFPRAFGAALVWFEGRAGLEETSKFSHMDLLRKFLEKSAVDASAVKCEVIKAPRFSMAILASMEVMVSDSTAALGLRVLAWARLVKVFGALRTDDMQRLRPDAVKLGEAGLTATLGRTKTSGPGKAVAVLKVYIPKDAFTVNQDWLADGYKVWKDTVVIEQDFFLGRAAKDLSSFEAKVARASDLSGMGTKLLTELCVPRFVGESEGRMLWVNTVEKILPGNLAAAFTGHSERATLTSILAAVGVPRAEREYIGRWAPKGGDEYVRTYRVLMRSMVMKYRALAQDKDLYTKIDEEDICEGIQVKLKGKGMSEGAVKNDINVYRERVKKVLHSMEEAMVSVVEVHVVVPKELPVPEVMKVEVEKVIEDEAKYVISEGYRGKVARLHRRDGCYRGRNLSFASYELVFGEPSQNSFTDVCRSCWPRGGPIWKETDEVNADSSDDGTTSSEGDS